MNYLSNFKPNLAPILTIACICILNTNMHAQIPLEFDPEEVESKRNPDIKLNDNAGDIHKDPRSFAIKKLGNCDHAIIAFKNDYFSSVGVFRHGTSFPEEYASTKRYYNLDSYKIPPPVLAMSCAGKNVRGDFIGNNNPEYLCTNGLTQNSNGHYTRAIIIMRDDGVKLINAHFGEDLSGWQIEREDEIVAVGDFDGNGKDDILIKNDARLGVLTVVDGRLKLLYSIDNGEKTDGWWHNTNSEYYFAVGDIDGNGNSEFVIRSGWGIGIFSFDNNGNPKKLFMGKYDSLLKNIFLDQNYRYAGIENENGEVALLISGICVI